MAVIAVVEMVIIICMLDYVSNAKKQVETYKRRVGQLQSLEEDASLAVKFCEEARRYHFISVRSVRALRWIKQMLNYEGKSWKRGRKFWSKRLDKDEWDHIFRTIEVADPGREVISDPDKNV